MLVLFLALFSTTSPRPFLSTGYWHSHTFSLSSCCWFSPQPSGECFQRLLFLGRGILCACSWGRTRSLLIPVYLTLEFLLVGNMSEASCLQDVISQLWCEHVYIKPHSALVYALQLQWFRWGFDEGNKVRMQLFESSATEFTLAKKSLWVSSS